MKNCLLTFFLLTITHFVYTQPIPPVRVEDCPSIVYPRYPIIDGKDDEGWWSPEQGMTIFGLSSEAYWTGQADFNITFKMAWGWIHFYTYINIVDDVEHIWNGTDGNPRDFDNVEWYFQLDTQTVPNAYTDNTVQIRFNRGETGFKSSTFREGISEKDFQWYSENTSDGWILECAIPWTNVMPNGLLPEDIFDYVESGGLIGFDVTGIDSDGTDPFVGDRTNGTQMAWDEDGEPGDVTDATENNAWNNTSAFGYLNIVGRWGSYVKNKYRGTIENIAYPNPAINYINISEPHNYSHIAIYSQIGDLLLKQAITNSSIDISSLKPGFYIVVFDNIETFIFIKE